MMASPYSPSQLTAYLSLIGLPKKYWPSSNPTRNFTMLKALHIHSISTHPYENLSLHYTPSVNVSLNPQDIYKKFMSNGRGGYCFEHAIFFNHILRAMGFSAHVAGVRIRMRVDGVPVGDYSGWRHAINIITLPSGLKYICDTGFGGDGPIQPLPLINGEITQNIGSQQLRLIHSHIPPQTLLNDEGVDKAGVDKAGVDEEGVDKAGVDEEGGKAKEEYKMWIYQYRNSPSPTIPWNSFYVFPSHLEFLQSDLEILNFYISHSPESFQTYRLLVVKFLRTAGKNEGEKKTKGKKKEEEGKGEDEEASIHAKIMLVGDLVKLNTGGRTSVIQTCRTEEERVEALRKHFGIELSEEERVGIRGRVTELGRLTENDASS